jgi:hypothetical protein
MIFGEDVCFLILYISVLLFMIVLCEVTRTLLLNSLYQTFFVLKVLCILMRILLAGYVILYTTDHTQRDREWVVEGIVGDKMTTTIKGLTADTMYHFKIQARNNKGYGPFSNIISFTTGPSE